MVAKRNQHSIQGGSRLGALLGVVEPPAAERTGLLDRALTGRRVRLVKTTDPWTKLKPGDEGTVVFIDSAKQMAVTWDSGSTLSLLPGIDQWDLLP